MSIRRPKKKALTLQLTSLLDMFTIILVFLLQSFQAEDENFTMHAGVELPVSDSRNPFTRAVNIAVDATGVFVEGQRVMALGDGLATDEQMAADKLEDLVQAVTAAADAQSLEGEDRVATIQADQTIPYDTIDMVMRNAAHAGCFRFRLVVEKT